MHVDLSTKAPKERPIEPLRWIGAYKIGKALLAVLGGLLVLRLMHRNLPDVAIHFMNRARISPHSLAGHFILRKVIAIHGQNLLWLAVTLFVYAPLSAAEGIGLMMRKVWAEWLTLVMTCLLIPVEIYEFVKRPTWVRIVIFVLNVAVAVYLAVRLRRDRRLGAFSVVARSAERRPAAEDQHAQPQNSGYPQK